MGKFQMFEIFLTILYQFMVAKYFHKFYIFQKSSFKGWQLPKMQKYIPDLPLP